MKSVKLAVIAALSSFAVSAFALSPMQDSDLSAVSGQDGVTIAANLNIDVGSFVYTDTDKTTGGSISFNDIQIRGAIAVEIDIVNTTVAGTLLGGVGVADPGKTLDPGTALSHAFYPGGDVVKISMPDIEVGKLADAPLAKAATTSGSSARKTNNLFFGVESIKLGNSDKSFGAMAMNDIKLQGTTVLIWAH